MIRHDVSIMDAMPAPWICLAVAAAGFAACTPALDWRDVAPPASHVRALFPCKPASHARNVALAGVNVEMTLYACRAEGATYALAFADLQDPARVPPALDALVAAARANLRVTQALNAQAAQVNGMTPYPRAVRFHVRGQSHDGRLLEEVGVVFGYGTQVMQATVLGEHLDEGAIDGFVGSLVVQP